MASGGRLAKEPSAIYGQRFDVGNLLGGQSQIDTGGPLQNLFRANGSRCFDRDLNLGLVGEGKRLQRFQDAMVVSRFDRLSHGTCLPHMPSHEGPVLES